MNILFVILFVNQSRYRSQKSGYSKIIEIHISLFGKRHNFFETQAWYIFNIEKKQIIYSYD